MSNKVFHVEFKKLCVKGSEIFKISHTPSRAAAYGYIPKSNRDSRAF